MKTLHTDVAVIGTGTAGMNAYRAAKAQGKRAIVIESGQYGTTCARVGCMPSKLLIAAAEASHAVDEAPRFGVHVEGDKRIDGREVMQRVRSERDRFVGFILDAVGSYPEADKLQGYATFKSDTVLLVDEHTEVHAKAVVIATGSTPAVPGMFKAAGDRLIVNDDVFEWADLPARVAVFGPGVIGLELGQALHRLGVHVRIFGLGGLLGGLNDPAVKANAQQVFQNELYLDTDADVKHIEQVGDEVEIRYVNLDGQETVERFDYLLAATGRRPNVAGLKLENTSLELDDKGVPVFDRYTMQAGKAPIFIAGDVNNTVPLLHEASDEGRIAGQNAANFPNVQPGKRRAPIAVVFCDPQILAVGKPFKELPDGFVTGEVNFDDQGRSRVMLKNRGLLHVYADPRTGEFLGAEMVGPTAEHMAHLLAWSVQQRLTVAQMLDMPFYHPVVEEGLRTALRDAQARLDELQARQHKAVA
ncbi:dihydrolipoyl dehydrogenase [Verticiella sediminum]|uniref:Dihydrolipoyl dehydrogenase n=1 Tax=Verticiella sediminum TaxID=1247510 RepID=A0A556ADV8_9BURK|nr:dihydrolipoyl dehydrogenase [Verticiella sediminum]TSH91072.1 dihydrolipoyl dehydrogenase [Verticiella sediminum]